jgi:uncharacterized protein (TIGR03083 family)
MRDDSVLAGFDPFDVFDREAVRLDAFFSTLREGEWSTSSRCPGWTIRDVLAHLTAAESYYRACLEGKVSEFMANLASRGATDLDSANQVGVDDLANFTPAELLGMWRMANLETRQGFRERGDDMIDTSVGMYPCRWQTFHVAAELATHADDMHVPIADDEDELRWAWRAAFSRFALTEAKPDLTLEELGDRRLRIRCEDVEFEVDEHELMEGVMNRLNNSSRLSAEQRALLSTM